jgi:hypothetical protein
MNQNTVTALSIRRLLLNFLSVYLSCQETNTSWFLNSWRNFEATNTKQGVQKPDSARLQQFSRPRCPDGPKNIISNFILHCKIYGRLNWYNHFIYGPVSSHSRPLQKTPYHLRPTVGCHDSQFGLQKNRSCGWQRWRYSPQSCPPWLFLLEICLGTNSQQVQVWVGFVRDKRARTIEMN